MHNNKEILPFFRVIISRLDEDEKWIVLSNPRWDYFAIALNMLLLNHANEYADYKNCGVLYRMIRVESIEKYFNETTLKPEWTLDPRDVPDFKLSTNFQ